MFSFDDCELAGDAESQRAAHRLTTIRSRSRTWYATPRRRTDVERKVTKDERVQYPVVPYRRETREGSKQKRKRKRQTSSSAILVVNTTKAITATASSALAQKSTHYRFIHLSLCVDLSQRF